MVLELSVLDSDDESIFPDSSSRYLGGLTVEFEYLNCSVLLYISIMEGTDSYNWFEAFL